MRDQAKLEKASYKNHLWFRLLVFFLFLVTVNLLAAYIAIELRYPSLYNVKASFAEYAIPLPFYWGMLHLPSMFIYGIPLLVLRKLHNKHIQYFRIFCLVSFLLLMLEFDNKIPFLLFPKVDALVALTVSYFLFPPNAKNNPKQFLALKTLMMIIVLLLGYFAFSFWKHQTPPVTKSQYADGIFELKAIKVNNNYRKEMLFHVELKEAVPEEQLCFVSQPMAEAILQDYPFDNSYKKIIAVSFNPALNNKDYASYQMGEISLNNAHKEKNGDFACYLKYKD